MCVTSRATRAALLKQHPVEHARALVRSGHQPRHPRGPIETKNLSE